MTRPTGGYIGTTPAYSSTYRPGVWSIQDINELYKSSQWPIRYYAPTYQANLTQVGPNSANIGAGQTYNILLSESDPGRPIVAITSAYFKIQSKRYGEPIFQQSPASATGFTTNQATAGYSLYPTAGSTRLRPIIFGTTTSGSISTVGFSTNILSTWTFTGVNGCTSPNIPSIGMVAGTSAFAYDDDDESAASWTRFDGFGDFDTPAFGCFYSATLSLNNTSFTPTSEVKIRCSAYPTSFTFTSPSGNVTGFTTSADGNSWHTFTNLNGKTITKVDMNYTSGRYFGGFAFYGIEVDGILQTNFRTTITNSVGFGTTVFYNGMFVENDNVGFGTTVFVGKVLGVAGTSLYVRNIVGVASQLSLDGKKLRHAYQPPVGYGISIGYFARGWPDFRIRRLNEASVSNWNLDYLYCNYSTAGPYVVGLGAGSGNYGVWQNARANSTYNGAVTEIQFGNTAWTGYLAGIRWISGNDAGVNTVSPTTDLWVVGAAGSYPVNSTTGFATGPAFDLYPSGVTQATKTFSNFVTSPPTPAPLSSDNIVVELPSTATINSVNSQSLSTLFPAGASITGYLVRSSSRSGTWNQTSIASTTIDRN